MPDGDGALPSLAREPEDAALNASSGNRAEVVARREKPDSVQPQGGGRVGIETEQDVARVLENAAKCSEILPGARPGPTYANVWHSLIGMAPIDDSYPEDKHLREYPSQAQMQALDLAYEWMTRLPIRGRKIMIYRAQGNNWAWIGRQVGLQRLWVQKLWRKYAVEIVTYEQQKALAGRKGH